MNVEITTIIFLLLVVLTLFAAWRGACDRVEAEQRRAGELYADLNAANQVLHARNEETKSLNERVQKDAEEMAALCRKNITLQKYGRVVWVRNKLKKPAANRRYGHVLAITRTGQEKHLMFTEHAYKQMEATGKKNVEDWP